MQSHSVAQAGLELLASSDPPILASFQKEYLEQGRTPCPDKGLLTAVP